MTMGQAGGTADTSGTSHTQVRVQPQDQQQAFVAQVHMEKSLAAIVIEISLVVALTDVEQRRYERFRKMESPQFQGGKTKDAYEVLVTCLELLETVGLAETHDV